MLAWQVNRERIDTETSMPLFGNLLYALA